MAKQKGDKTNAIIALILTVIGLPWVAALILKDKNWIPILVLWIVGVGLTVTFIGAILGGPILLAVWIWGLIISIKALQE